jgi:DNA-binding NtrC family response regulator
MSVLREMRDRWPEREVIVITGYPSVDTAKEAIRIGAHNYLAKPLEPAEVLEATARAIEHKQWALRREFTPRRAGGGSDIGGSARQAAPTRTEC